MLYYGIINKIYTKLEVKNMNNASLVLEGGGMRGLYTAGVLDFFYDKNIEFSSLYGVSAGACHGCNYLSKQRERGLRIYTDYIGDKRYMSISSLIRTGDYFSKDFNLNIIPNELNKYDYETMRKSQCDFYAVVTNCESGKAEYLKIEDLEKDIDKVWASSSLPMISRMVTIEGKKYLDGGICDSIPIKKSIRDGNNKNIIILTRDSTYIKMKTNIMPLLKIKYKKYPNLIKALENRHIMYNETLKYIKEQEKQNKVFIIRPQKKVKIGRLEKNKEKLYLLYKEGYKDAENKYNDLLAFLK